MSQTKSIFFLLVLTAMPVLIQEKAQGDQYLLRNCANLLSVAKKYNQEEAYRQTKTAIGEFLKFQSIYGGPAERFINGSVRANARSQEKIKARMNQRLAYTTFMVSDLSEIDATKFHVYGLVRIGWEEIMQFIKYFPEKDINPSYELQIDALLTQELEGAEWSSKNLSLFMMSVLSGLVNWEYRATNFPSETLGSVDLDEIIFRDPKTGKPEYVALIRQHKFGDSLPQK